MKFIIVLPVHIDASASLSALRNLAAVQLVDAPSRDRALDWARDRDLLGAVVCTAYPDDLERFKGCTEISP